MTALNFIIGSLATFRIATMIAQEKGPGHVFCILRKAPKSPVVRDGLSCPLCVSVYSAALMTVFFLITGLAEAHESFAVWLAMSGASVALSLTVAKDL